MGFSTSSNVSRLVEWRHMFRLISILLLAFMAWGCGDGSSGDGTVDSDDTYSDTDTDIETGTDADADSDADIDSDTDNCGDSAASGTEVCDDGPGEGQGACLDDCSGYQICGDGTTNGTEACDPGAADSAACDLSDGVSVQSCTLAECGDGYVNAAAGETCDDGDTLAGDGCDALCHSESVVVVTVWRSNDTLGGTIGTDEDILFARSVDGGATWGYPAPLNTSAATGSGIDFIPQLALDSSTGTAVAVWWSDDSLGGTIGADRDIQFARSLDAGATWSATAALNTNAATDSLWDYAPDVTVDAVTGTWMAVWRSQENVGGTIGTDQDILFARSLDSGATWSFPASLNTNATTDSGNDWDPSITVDGSTGTWVATWLSADTLGGTIGTDDDILFARSLDAGSTWSAPAPLNENAATDSRNDRGARVTVDSSTGTWIAAWGSTHDLGGAIGTDRDILFRRSLDGGATWSTTAVLNTNANTDSSSDGGPYVTVDSSTGIWAAVWSSNNDLDGTIGTDNDIMLARSLDGGATWSDPLPLNTNAATDSGSDSAVRLVRYGTTWVAVWYSWDDLGGSIGTDGDILTARSLDSGATWSDPLPLNANAATDSGNDASPQVVIMGQ